MLTPRGVNEASNSEGFVALLDNAELQIRFGTGRYNAGTGTGSLPSQEKWFSASMCLPV